MILVRRSMVSFRFDFIRVKMTVWLCAEAQAESQARKRARAVPAFCGGYAAYAVSAWYFSGSRRPAVGGYH
jgi:hypothetical protein